MIVHDTSNNNELIHLSFCQQGQIFSSEMVTRTLTKIEVHRFSICNVAKLYWSLFIVQSHCIMEHLSLQ